MSLIPKLTKIYNGDTEEWPLMSDFSSTTLEVLLPKINDPAIAEMVQDELNDRAS